ncbi:hypothetical protein VD0004_g6267 [Verticillium dahliae]|uniref:Succinate dehydrogenase assembly factor 2, mitochondrial n=2 Tax=Verticillium dahliae TaxID=27337 RepID=G2WR40_VERDV|nr:TPR repeat protein [Verticillium dahliae VdLs.17]KAH6709780.1 TPR repeat protein [Verticillium dahliae]EGY13341.1 TPR repeat protein [Verticillium dahliae VdLs.17]PNH29580.1 hypothetical protein BJF96_g7023 [Verticillium dahliae]PNH40761.1 hypothetical protein VD0004_g6267 [Verticillium dahliae]PNH51509.1 hypothetical protein VD0003_g5759 [Verticillium dahliae]
MASVMRSLARPVCRPSLLRPVAPAVLRTFASKPDPIQIDSQIQHDLEVGELQGAKFKIEPLRRTGEDATTMRARLLYQCRKRGTLESDLLLSTFADTHLPTMSHAQMQQYDLFLDENDWDIYYWATQDESPGPDTTPTKLRPSSSTSQDKDQDKELDLDSATVAGGESYRGVNPGAAKTIDAGNHGHADTPKPAEDVQVREQGTGEWAQTVGTFKPAYRPVPARWKGSEILDMLRAHVRARRAGGKGMAFMPPLFNVEARKP